MRRLILAAVVSCLLVAPIPVATAGTAMVPEWHHCYDKKPKDVWPIAKRAWKRPNGPTGKDRARYREIWRCVDDKDRARRKWQHAKKRYYLETWQV